jgi:hypothetical protein
LFYVRDGYSSTEEGMVFMSVNAAQEDRRTVDNDVAVLQLYLAEANVLTYLLKGLIEVGSG